jgi:hypothetical protein
MEEGIRTAFSFIYKAEAAQCVHGKFYLSLIVIGLPRTEVAGFEDESLQIENFEKFVLKTNPQPNL